MKASERWFMQNCFPLLSTQLNSWGKIRVLTNLFVGKAKLLDTENHLRIKYWEKTTETLFQVV